VEERVEDRDVLGYLREQRAAGEVRRLVRAGVGVRENTWSLPLTSATDQRLIDEVLAWVSDVTASMARPNGIDHVSMALSLRDASGRVRTATTLGIRPLREYLGEPGRAALARFLADARLVAPEGGLLRVVIVSMGELLLAFERAA